MKLNDCRAELITAATPLLAMKEVNGVCVTERVKAGLTNLAMVSHYFGNKDGLYQAVLKEIFAELLELAEVSGTSLAPSQTFKRYLCQCGICFDTAGAEGLNTRTGSVVLDRPAGPLCRKKEAESFIVEKRDIQLAA